MRESSTGRGVRTRIKFRHSQFGLYQLSVPRDLLLVPHHRFPCRYSQAVPFPSGDHVYMKVRDYLVCRLTVELQYIQAVGRQAGSNGLGQRADSRGQLSVNQGLNLEDILEM